MGPVQMFIEYLQYEKRYSAHTILAYGEDLSQFSRYLQSTYEKADPLQAAALHIRSWMAGLAEEGVKPRSINRKLSCLRSFYTYGRRKGLISVNPAAGIRVLRTPKRLPSFVEERQMRMLMEDIPFPAGPEGALHRLIIDLLYQTGMRVSELLQIRPEDMGNGNGTLRVLGKGKKERIIPLSEGMLTDIRSYLTEKDREQGGRTEGFILETKEGRRMSARQVYAIVKRYLSQVTTAEKKSPHVLRHSFATHLTNHGADLNAVKELLGHSSLAATQVYTHNSIDKLREAHRKAHPKG
jgi:integrase/recombinase XerC